MENYSQEVERFFVASIRLEDDKVLKFTRETNYKGLGMQAIHVNLIDTFESTNTLIGTFFAGKWTFTTPYHECIFWSLAKEHRPAVKRNIKRLTVPEKEFQPLNMQWRCFKRKFHLQSTKISRRIQLEHYF